MADIKTLAKVADIDFVRTFTENASKLLQMVGTMEAIPANAGETLKQRQITGTLSTDAYVEGELVPLTKYQTTDVQTFEITLKPYRVVTTLQDVQKRGYERAVVEKDTKLISDMQADIKQSVITALETGTFTATGKSLIKTAANAWATLQNEVEDNGFGDVEPVFFCNPLDFATNIGDSDVFSAFGFQYIQNWVGLGNLISTSKVPQGTIYCTAKQNLKVYYIPADTAQGFEFYTDESGLVAVQHDTVLNKLSYETVAWSALLFFAEYTNFIVKGTIAPSA